MGANHKKCSFRQIQQRGGESVKLCYAVSSDLRAKVSGIAGTESRKIEGSEDQADPQMTYAGNRRAD